MQAGQQVRDYILDRLIGEGGMGEVWLAHHAYLERRVAIKVMAERLAHDAHFRERFLTEARAMAGLQHPRIVGALEFFEEGGRLYLVMPYVDGRSLADRLEAHPGPMAPQAAVALMRDVLEALDYAHKNGVIHRDVKPANILVDGGGRAYLTDFGIALMVGDARKTRTGTSVGTAYYMSPEQIAKPKSVDHRTDVYACGCVLYEMVTGRPPFIGDGEDEGSDFLIRTSHVNEAPEGPKSLNPAIAMELEKVILRALEKDPGARFHGCGEFKKALEGISITSTIASASPQRVGATSSRTIPSLSGTLVEVSQGLGVAVAVFPAARAGETWTNPKDGLTYVYIPPGTFQMGGVPGDSACLGDEKPRHGVTISKGFWMGQTEVTVGAYKRFCSATGRSMPKAPSFNANWQYEDHPIVNVDWKDAKAYSEWAGGRLPTEAEWEYAARVGTETVYCWGGAVAGDYAWHDGNSGNRTHPVGKKKANGWALFDMVGNVWEWCSDWYDEGYYANSPRTDPAGPMSGGHRVLQWMGIGGRVLRGGSWDVSPVSLRVSYRSGYVPDGRYGDYGFRVVVSTR